MPLTECSHVDIKCLHWRAQSKSGKTWICPHQGLCQTANLRDGRGQEVVPGQNQCRFFYPGQTWVEKPFLIHPEKQSSQTDCKKPLPAVYSLPCRILGYVSVLFQTSLFGEGTYLTSDLSLALLYSPHGLGWQRSTLGSILSCVAVCEIIDHPDVKCQVKKKGEPVAVTTTNSLVLIQHHLYFSSGHIHGLTVQYIGHRDTLQQLPFLIDPSNTHIEALQSSL